MHSFLFRTCELQLAAKASRIYGIWLLCVLHSIITDLSNFIHPTDANGQEPPFSHNRQSYKWNELFVMQLISHVNGCLSLYEEMATYEKTREGQRYSFQVLMLWLVAVERSDSTSFYYQLIIIC